MENLQEHINNELHDDIKKLYDHAEIANKEMGNIKVSLESLTSDIGWLKNFFWIIAGSSIGGLLTGIFNLLIK